MPKRKVPTQEMVCKELAAKVADSQTSEIEAKTAAAELISLKGVSCISDLVALCWPMGDPPVHLFDRCSDAFSLMRDVDEIRLCKGVP